MKYGDIMVRNAPMAKKKVVEKNPVEKNPVKKNPVKKNGRNPHYWWSGVGALLGLGVSMAAYAYWHEPFNVALEELTFHLPSAKGCLPKEGLRILHLSDTHFQGRNQREQIKIDCIRRLTDDLTYDLLIHTGDFWHLESGLENVIKLLDVLPKPRIGSYGVFGNHDYMHYDSTTALPRMWQTFRKREAARRNGNSAFSFLEAADTLFQFWRFGQYVRNTPLDLKRTGTNDPEKLTLALKSCGMEVLHNRSIHLGHQSGAPNGLDLYLAGVDDVQEGRPHLGDTLADVPHDKPVILLSHNPDILESPRIACTDVVLSGHTHGGQIVLPFWGPAHTQAQHISRADVSGYLRRGKTHVYITRGVGEGIPLRFGAQPQIALITLKAE